MGVLTLDTSGDSIRWRDPHGKKYVHTPLPVSNIENNVAEKGFPKAPLARRNKHNFYMLEDDLEATIPPDPFHIFYDNEKFIQPLTITSVREGFKQSLFDIFKGKMGLSYKGFQDEDKSGNPYNRFDNSPETTRYYWFPSKDEGMGKALTELKENKKILNTNHILNQEPKDKIMLSANRKFYTYYDPPGEAKIDVTNLEGGKTLAAHKKFFENPFGSYKKNVFTHQVIRTGDLKAWRNIKRSPQQYTVMNNNSATDIAVALGLPNPQEGKYQLSYEWLHLIAYSMGPAKYQQTPQNSENLVLGTTACNTMMMAYENLIKSQVKKEDYLEINVKKTLVYLGKTKNKKKDVYASWLASRIEYTYCIINDGEIKFVETIAFDPFQRIVPSFGEYKLIRKVCAISDFAPDNIDDDPEDFSYVDDESEYSSHSSQYSSHSSEYSDEEELSGQNDDEMEGVESGEPETYSDAEDEGANDMDTD
jgi:hypothetical protein